MRLDGGGKAFRKQWGYDLAPPPTLLEEEEDEDEPDDDDISETQSLREDFFSRQSALGQSRRGLCGLSGGYDCVFPRLFAMGSVPMLCTEW